MGAKLTAKQENFCIAFIEHGNATAAYRTAYNADRMKESTINKRASELLGRGDITGRLDELRQPAIDNARMTLQGHLEALADLRDSAKDSGNWSAAITAEISRGKASGFYRNSEGTGALVQVNVDTRRPEEMSDEELMAIIAGNGLTVVPNEQYREEIKELFNEL